MQEWMRKHRRLLYFFVFLFIGVPMVLLFGMPQSNPSQQASSDTVIAKVGNVPITESEFRRRLDAVAAQRAQQGGERPDYRELDENGTVELVIEQLTDAALVTIQEQQRSFTVDETLLAKQMQKWDWFQDEDDNFNHEAWNEWVASISNWDEIYGELRETIARQVFLGTVTAPSGRILERKIDEELLTEQTKLKFKHAKVELKITPTEEEIQTHYDENPDAYREPELNQVEFLAVSTIPEVPAIALELVERARAGEDFSALADEYSDQKKPEGGAMGWRRAGDYVSPHLKPFFALSYTEVSDPVLGPSGYIIYKVEEERTNEVTGEIELNGSQIVLNTEIDEETLEARKKIANEASAKLLEGVDIQAVADEYGLEVLRTDFFNRMNLEIENVHHEDIYTFRGQMLAQTDSPWKPVEAKRHIYVGKIVETKEGDLPALEEVREKAIDNVKNETKRTEEYQQHLEERMDILRGHVESVDAIAGLDADLSVEIGETEEPVTRTDSLFQKKIYVQTTDIFAELKEKEVGEVGGPIKGFLGAYWFFELIERDAPTTEQLAELDEERQEIKDRIIQTAQYEILTDYTKDLRERMMANVPFTQDTAAFDRILGRNWEEEGEGEEAGSEGEEAAEGEDATDEGEEAAEGDDSTEEDATPTEAEVVVEEGDPAVAAAVSAEPVEEDVAEVIAEEASDNESPAVVEEVVDAAAEVVEVVEEVLEAVVDAPAVPAEAVVSEEAIAPVADEAASDVAVETLSTEVEATQNDVADTVSENTEQ